MLESDPIPERAEEDEKFEKMTGKEFFTKASEAISSQTGFEVGFLQSSGEGAFWFGSRYINPESPIIEANIEIRWANNEGLHFSAEGTGRGKKETTEQTLESTKFNWSIIYSGIKGVREKDNPDMEAIRQAGQSEQEGTLKKYIQIIMERELQVPRGLLDKLIKASRLTKEVVSDQALVKKEPEIYGGEDGKRRHRELSELFKQYLG